MSANDIVKQLLEDGNVTPGKYWLTPEAHFMRCGDHEESAWEILASYGIENTGQDDIDLTWAYTELHKRGYVRIVVTDDSIIMSGYTPSPSQMKAARQAAMDRHAKLIFDYGGDRQYSLYDPTANSSSLK